VVRQAIDACSEILREPRGESARAFCLARDRNRGASEHATDALHAAALFVVEYALAMWWQSLV